MWKQDGPDVEAVLHQAWQSKMAISSFLQHVGCRQAQLPYNLKMANNYRQSRGHLLLQLVNELIAGQRAKTTSKPLLGGKVKVLKK